MHANHSHAQRPGTNRHVRHVVSNFCSKYVTTAWGCELVLLRHTAVQKNCVVDTSCVDYPCREKGKNENIKEYM